MINKNRITDVFFDLDHTLWDFEKNSALTFEKIFDELSLDLNLNKFLVTYEMVNHEYWKLYRENTISQTELRYKRLIKTFQAINLEPEPKILAIISDKYILYLSTYSNLIKGAISLLKYLQKQLLII